jgi:hypothetical protein
MFGLDITKEQASSLRKKCEAIEAQPEGRQWRDGDMVRQNTGEILIFIQGEPHWVHAGKSSLSRSFFESSVFTYIGNLLDLLAQGEILIALKETELLQVVNWSHGTHTQLMAKLASCLADYRERRRQHETTA